MIRMLWHQNEVFLYKLFIIFVKCRSGWVLKVYFCEVYPTYDTYIRSFTSLYDHFPNLNIWQMQKWLGCLLCLVGTWGLIRAAYWFSSAPSIPGVNRPWHWKEISEIVIFADLYVFGSSPTCSSTYLSLCSGELRFSLWKTKFPWHSMSTHFPGQLYCWDGSKGKLSSDIQFYQYN